MVSVTCRSIDCPQCALLLMNRKRIHGNTHLDYGYNISGFYGGFPSNDGRLHAAQWKMLRRFGRMHVTIHWLTNDSSGCWSKAEVESVSVLQEGLGESGQSYFLHSHHLSHPVGSIVVLEIETVRPSETLRHLTNVNPRLHLSLVYVYRSLYFVSASNVSEKHYCQKGKGTQANSNDKLKLKCTL